MRIAVNTRGFLDSATDNAFIYECCKKIIVKHFNHHFIFITATPLEEGFSSLKNITSLVIDAEIKTALPAQLWYNYKLPALLKKHKADILINANGICSQRAKIPQLVLLQSLLFLDYPQFVSKKYLQFCKKFTPSSLNKATTVLTVSQSAKKDIIESYKIDEDKIDIVHCGASELFKAIEWKEKELIKEKYTEGKEFFLFTGLVDAANNLITLLKAFSFFKKRQKSNMQLVITVTSPIKNEAFTESLKTYKYRNEVKLIQNLPQQEQAKITAAAYAFVYPSYLEDDGNVLAEAMKCEIPLIVSDTIFFHEICADAALYANPNKQEDIADKMMLVFKDEKKRNELIENGKLQSQQYSWEKAADLLWLSILKTVQ